MHATIQQGAKGPEVKQAQQSLTARGYNAGGLDGLFGPRTTQAVRHDQTDRRSATVEPLVVDGIVGPQTWARLDPPTIRNGENGNSVKLLQELLGQNGFGVAIDGAFGPKTTNAVKAYQTWTGTLVVDGIAGPHTWTALHS